MIKTSPIQLEKDQLVLERPFTHPDHVAKDREILLYMLKQVCAVRKEYFDRLTNGLPLRFDEADGHLHRFQIPRPDVLSQAAKIYLVGFLGHKRKGVNPDHFDDLGERFSRQIPTLPQILSYSTMALPQGDFSNLVLVSDEQVILTWMKHQHHQRAVQLSESYYQSVRINNGVLPYGIRRPDNLQITRVKYYDYRQLPPWKALRKIRPA